MCGRREGWGVWKEGGEEESEKADSRVSGGEMLTSGNLGTNKGLCSDSKRSQQKDGGYKLSIKG